MRVVPRPQYDPDGRLGVLHVNGLPRRAWARALRTRHGNARDATQYIDSPTPVARVPAEARFQSHLLPVPAAAEGLALVAPSRVVSHPVHQDVVEVHDGDAIPDGEDGGIVPAAEARREGRVAPGRLEGRLVVLYGILSDVDAASRMP